MISSPAQQYRADRETSSYRCQQHEIATLQSALFERVVQDQRNRPAGGVALAVATVATRGSTQASVPFNPATVEVTGGPALNTVGIEVRELLFFGGDLTNEAFHMFSVC